MNDQTREHRAYHEAGHAVAAYILHKRPLKVSIIPEGYSMARTIFIMPSRQDRPPNKSWAERHILHLLAGPAAERKFDPEVDDSPSREDWEHARGYANQAWGGDNPEWPHGDSVGAYLTWMDGRAESLISQPSHWAAILAVAKELLHSGEIREHALRTIIREAIT